MLLSLTFLFSCHVSRVTLCHVVTRLQERQHHGHCAHRHRLRLYRVSHAEGCPQSLWSRNGRVKGANRDTDKFINEIIFPLQKLIPGLEVLTTNKRLEMAEHVVANVSHILIVTNSAVNIIVYAMKVLGSSMSEKKSSSFLGQSVKILIWAWLRSDDELVESWF